jgi:NitT/TauT family transport system substrate-binding protein
MNRSFIAVIFTIVLLCTACTTQSSPTGQAIAQETAVVRIGHLPATHGLPLYLAMDKGYFEQEGLSVEVVKFDSPNLLLQALATGQIDFGAPSTAAGITSIVESKRPGELKIFAAGGSSTKLDDSINEVLIVRKDSSITRMQDLEGKTVGILPSIQWRTIATHVFAQEGIAVGTDVTLVELAPGLQVQALAAGQVDALLTIEPVGTTARVKGISRELVHAPIETYLADPFYGGAGVLRTAFAEENPRTTEKVLRVFSRAIDDINADPDAVKSHLPKYTPIDAALADEVPYVAFKMSDDLTAQDKQGLQTFFDIFYHYNVTSTKVDVEQMLYRK